MENLINLKKLVHDNIKILEGSGNIKENFGYLETGIEKLDKLIHGFRRGSLTIIGGANSTGKTRLLCKLCTNIANHVENEVVVLYTTDRVEDLALKMLSVDSKIPIKNLINRNLVSDDLKNLARSMIGLNNKNIIIMPLNGKTANDLKKDINELIAKKINVRMIAIDNLQLVTPDSSPEEIHDHLVTSRELKSMSVQFNVPFVLITDLNRKSSSRLNKRPNLDDIHYYSAATNFSGLVIFIYVDEHWNPDTREPGIAELIVAKNNEGDTGTIKLTTDFESIRSS